MLSSVVLDLRKKRHAAIATVCHRTKASCLVERNLTGRRYLNGSRSLVYDSRYVQSSYGNGLLLITVSALRGILCHDRSVASWLSFMIEGRKVSREGALVQALGLGDAISSLSPQAIMTRRQLGLRGGAPCFGVKPSSFFLSLTLW